MAAVENKYTFPGGSVVKNLACSSDDTGDWGLKLGSGRCFGGGNGNPLQYSCLDRGTWRAILHRVAENGT